MLVFAVLADRQAPLQEYARLAIAVTIIVLGSGLLLWPLAGPVSYTHLRAHET